MSTFNSTLTADQLRGDLHYDESTGDFTRIRPIRGRKTGTIAGHKNIYGYTIIMVSKVNYPAHRLAWLYVFGKWPDALIDHIDGDKSNNRISNLREASKVENGQNRKFARRDSSTGIIGVTKHGKHGWRAQITINKRTIRLGTFKSIDLAREAYLQAKKLHHPFSQM